MNLTYPTLVLGSVRLNRDLEWEAVHLDGKVIGEPQPTQEAALLVLKRHAALNQTILPKGMA